MRVTVMNEFCNHFVAFQMFLLYYWKTIWMIRATDKHPLRIEFLLAHFSPHRRFVFVLDDILVYLEFKTKKIVKKIVATKNIEINFIVEHKLIRNNKFVFYFLSFLRADTAEKISSHKGVQLIAVNHNIKSFELYTTYNIMWRIKIYLLQMQNCIKYFFAQLLLF